VANQTQSANQPQAPNQTFAGKDPMTFKSPKGGTPTMMIATAQGSRYLITSDGMVLRNKSFHANTGGGDQGLKNWSDVIEFYDPGELPGGTTFPMSVYKAVEKGLPVGLSKTQDGKRALLILDGSQWRVAKISDVYKHVATADDPIVATYSTTPKLNWNVLDYTLGANKALKNVHPGSPVTHGIRLGPKQGVAEEKQRLDPSCWKGYKKQGTKMKGDTRVNNCVPANEAANAAQQAAIAINMKKAHKKPKNESDYNHGFADPKAPSLDRNMGMRNSDRNAGLETETNNIAIAINGKTWKVIPGKGYADSAEERSYLQGMERWAEKKSAASGKQWTVHLTGASVTEALEEGWKSQIAAAAMAGAAALGGASNAHADVWDQVMRPVQQMRQVDRDVHNRMGDVNREIWQQRSRVGRDLENIPIGGIDQIGREIRGSTNQTQLHVDPAYLEKLRQSQEQQAQRQAEYQQRMQQTRQRNRDEVDEGNFDNPDFDWDKWDNSIDKLRAKAKAADQLKAQGKKPQTRWNPKTGKYYVDFTGDERGGKGIEERVVEYTIKQMKNDGYDIL
jgi:hypothetical protein